MENKICSCGEDLVKAKRANRVNYWITYRGAGYETRMREGEVLGISRPMTSFKDRIFTLPGKLKEKRIVPISDRLFDIIVRLPRGIQQDAPIFTNKGKAIHDIRTGLKEACAKAGIPYGRFK